MKLALVRSDPLKPTLLVVKAPQGPEWYHWPVPQSTTPAGYCPLSGWFCPGRSSNVTVCAPGVAVLVGVVVRVAVAVAVAVPAGVVVGVVLDVAVGAGVLVGVPVVPVAVAVGEAVDVGVLVRVLVAAAVGVVVAVLVAVKVGVGVPTGPESRTVIVPSMPTSSWRVHT